VGCFLAAGDSGEVHVGCSGDMLKHGGGTGFR
jgi:hypothetical protein